MTQNITLSWHPDRPTEELSSADAVVERLIEISLGTTSGIGIAFVLAKPNGQEMIVIVAGRHWALNWFPEDYLGRGCVGSYHTVAADSKSTSNDIVTYFVQGHHSECLASETIGKEVDIQAIRQFLASSQRPDCVHWNID